MIKKKTIALYFIVFLIVALFGQFGVTPLRMEFVYLLTVISFFGVYKFFQRPMYLDKGLRIWFFVFTALLIISIVQGYFSYGQSIFSGFVANVRIWQIWCVYLIAFYMKRYRVPLLDIFSKLTMVAWVVFAFYLVMLIFNIEITLVSDVTDAERGLTIDKVPKGLTDLIGFLFLCRFFYSNRYKYFGAAILLLSINQWGDIQRFSLMAIIVTIFFALRINRRLKSSFKIVASVLVAVPVAVIIIMNTNTALADNLSSKYGEVFKLFSANDNNNVDDVSIAVRVLGVKYALEGFEESPIFGKGDVRASEREEVGMESNFYLSDIGLVGVLYAFGIIGILIYAGQIRRLYLMTSSGHQNPYEMCLILALFYLLLFTVLSGRSLFIPTHFLMILVLSKVHNHLKTIEAHA